MVQAQAGIVAKEGELRRREHTSLEGHKETQCGEAWWDGDVPCE